MPIYEYRCNECKHEVEALQKLSDPPLVKCPACGKDALTKLVSAAGFQLKGSGWYVTDFRGGSGASKGAKTDAPSPDAAKSEAKTESGGKTETAAPAAPAAPSTPTSGSSES
ncbi:MAG: zinc ribbon domain-containing protein [Burkholderiales bacterium]